MIIKTQDNAPMNVNHLVSHKTTQGAIGSRLMPLAVLGGMLMSLTISLFYVDVHAETPTDTATTTAEIEVRSTTTTTIYKWQDAQGNTHYSETPPAHPQTVQQQTDISERIGRYSGQASVNHADSSEPDKTKTHGLQANMSEHSANAGSYCEKQRNSLALLQNNQFVKWKTNDQDIILEGEAKAAKTVALQKEIKQYCQ
ncbi:MAG: DUF4124 domain-containing protein [bacterium]